MSTTWISVEDELPGEVKKPCAIIVYGEAQRCCGFIQQRYEMERDGEVIPHQPAEWWLDCEGINVATSGVTDWLAIPPPKEQADAK